ncbi:TetR/AcrR family transcriptional regulator [Nesterenkonia sp. HG001]|uniref:TetR/AcrR family transcriptional regulator n=1 Tax=Nesterenkonia sp. HG001 TaxID=2983207 RepID=UPI002AC382F0|nr:TetR/AcrR family transcriptional regulator [Nesterenkonia sp. HG001]MDZ5078046.1 TetR/AcrR family transcriptional regulator [Nesterenkonia sp. HG001]
MNRVMLSRSAVIERGAALADTQGYSALTLSAVARSLNVQAPSLYTHVGSLAALRDGIAILALQELSEMIADAIMGRSRKSALTGFADAHRRYARSRPGCWEALQKPMGVQVAKNPAAHRLVQTANSVLWGYGIAKRDHVHPARIVGSAINGFVNLERVGSFAHSQPEADCTWPELLGALDTILDTWTTRSTNPMRKSS